MTLPQPASPRSLHKDGVQRKGIFRILFPLFFSPFLTHLSLAKGAVLQMSGGPVLPLCLSEGPGPFHCLKPHSETNRFISITLCSAPDVYTHTRIEVSPFFSSPTSSQHAGLWMGVGSDLLIRSCGGWGDFISMLDISCVTLWVLSPSCPVPRGPTPDLGRSS